MFPPYFLSSIFRLNNNRTPLTAISNFTKNQFVASSVALNNTILPVNLNTADVPKYRLSRNRANEATANGINKGGLLPPDLEIVKIALPN